MTQIIQVDFNQPVKQSAAPKTTRVRKARPDQLPCDPQLKAMVAEFAQMRDIPIMEVVREAFEAYGLGRKYAKLLEERLESLKKTAR